MYYTKLGVGEESDSEFANWHVEAQLFWVSALLIASLVLIYLALRRLDVRYAGALLLPVLVVEFAAGAYTASKLPGPDDLRAAVLAVILSLELVGLTSAPGPLRAAPASGSDEEDTPTAARRRNEGLARRCAEPLGIGLLITAIQFAVLIFDQFFGLWEPPGNLLNLRIDKQLLWFVLVVGGSSVVMVYLALRHLAVRAAAWVVVPAVLLQFGLATIVDTHAAGRGQLHPVLIAALLPAELLILSLCLGERSTRPS